MQYRSLVEGSIVQRLKVAPSGHKAVLADQYNKTVSAIPDKPTQFQDAITNLITLVQNEPKENLNFPAVLPIKAALVEKQKAIDDLTPLVSDLSSSIASKNTKLDEMKQSTNDNFLAIDDLSAEIGNTEIALSKASTALEVASEEHSSLLDERDYMIANANEGFYEVLLKRSADEFVQAIREAERQEEETTLLRLVHDKTKKDLKKQMKRVTKSLERRRHEVQYLRL